MRAVKLLNSLVLSGIAATLLLSACGGGKDKAAEIPGDDAALSAALHDPLMVDPDLTSQNQRGAALGGGGPASAMIPPEQTGREVIAAAKADAETLLGGPIQSAPLASSATGKAQAAQDARTLAATVLAGTPGARCTATLAYSAQWAAKLPDGLPIYPRGHVQEAAGSDAAGCKLRVVHYHTPVSPADVIDFTYSSARKAGYSAIRHSEGGDDVLTGAKGAASYTLYARKRADGLSEVDLVTN
jgi:hypothetical protein